MTKETNNNNKSSAPSQDTKVKTTVADKFQALLRWLDVNILPLVALPVLAVLAADDIKSHLTHVTPEVALGVGIAFAAILAVKSHNK